MSHNFNPRFHEWEHIVSSNACAPSTRTIILAAWKCVGDDTEVPMAETEIYPVIAIRTTVSHLYLKSAVDKDFRVSSTPEGLERLGWRLESTQIRTDPLVAEPDLQRLGQAFCSIEDLSDLEPDFMEVVSAPWDPAEDGERLKPYLERARIRATQSTNNTSDSDSLTQAVGGDDVRLRHAIIGAWHDNPEMSNRGIAKKVGCSPGYVSIVLKKLKGTREEIKRETIARGEKSADGSLEAWD